LKLLIDRANSGDLAISVQVSRDGRSEHAKDEPGREHIQAVQ